MLGIILLYQPCGWATQCVEKLQGNSCASGGATTLFRSQEAWFVAEASSLRFVFLDSRRECTGSRQHSEETPRFEAAPSKPLVRVLFLNFFISSVSSRGCSFVIALKCPFGIRSEI